MNNKKGFTLIELLAVIVILAIIALIATPIVLNVIKNAQIESNKRSADIYIDTAEKEVVANMLKEGSKIDELCNVNSKGNLDCDGKEIKIGINGSKPNQGKVNFVKGKIESSVLCINGMIVESTIDGTKITGTCENDSLKLPGAVRLSETVGYYTYPEEREIEIIENISGGSLSCQSSDEKVATCKIEENVLKIKAGKKESSATITVTSKGNAKYKEASVAYVATTKKGILSVTANNYTGVYDGNYHSITVASPNSIIKYGIEEGSYNLEENPKYKDVGTYTVYYEITRLGFNTVTGFRTVTIEKAEGNIELSNKEGTVEYEKTIEEEIIKNVSNGEIEVVVKDEDIASASIEDNKLVIKGKQTGSTTITLIVSETKNYESTNIEYKVNVIKANNKLTLSSNVGTYTYPDKGTFTVTENKSGGELSCTSSDTKVADCTIKDNIVTVTPGTKKGVATLTIVSKETNNYNKGQVAHVATTKEGILNYSSFGYTGVYDGLEYGITVTSSGSIITYGLEEGSYNLEENPTYKDVGTYTVYYKITKEGYEPITGSETVTIEKAEGRVTAPTAKTLTYNETEQTLINAGTSTTGTIKYKLGEDGIYSTNLPKATNAGTYTVYYKVEGDKNHFDVEEKSITITITKATLQYTAEGYSGIYDEKEHGITVESTKGTIKYGNVSGTYNLDESPTYKDVGTYTVYFKITREGYVDVTGSKTVIIAKANNTLTLDSNVGTYTYPDGGTFKIKENKSGGTLTCTSSNKNIADCSISGNTVTVTLGTTKGTATLTIKSATTKNYNEGQAAFVATTNAGTLSVTANNYTGVYDGLEHGITVTSSGATIKYGTANGTYNLTSSPTYKDAGTYTVYYQVTRAGFNIVTGSRTVTIEKAEGSVTAPTAKSLTYTGSAQNLINAGSTTTGTIKYKVGSGSYSESIPSATNAGEYTVYYKVVGDKNHNDVAEKSLTVTIQKANGSVTAPTAKTLTYTGSAQNLINEGSTTTGTIKYKVGSGSYSESIPTATNAGTYTVYYKVIGDANHNDVAEKSIKVTIAKKNNTLTLSANSGTYTYPTSGTFKVNTNTSGGTLSCSSSNTNVATCSISETTVTVTPGTTAGTATITVTSAATTNYNSASAAHVVTGKLGTLSITANGYSAAYDGAAHGITVTSSGATIKYGTTSGTYNLTSSPTYTDVGTYTVYYQVSKTGYNTVTGSRTVTISVPPCPYSVGKTWTFSYKSSADTFTVSCPGTYKIELWGAQGGTNNTDAGGLGGYTSGNIVLSFNKILYIYVGSQASGTTGGYNGGATGGTVTDGIYTGGGGATDVRLVSGTWSDFNSLKSRIMVAGAGAGTGNYWGLISGGSAGGLIGYDGAVGYCIGTTPNMTIIGSGGTQTYTGNSGYRGGFGYATDVIANYGTGGGSGYYGGSTGAVANCMVASGGGGSSFISGHNGCNAINESSTSSSITHSGQSVHYSGYKFTNTVMVDGQGYNWTTSKGNYTGMPNHAGTGTMTGNTGNGYAKITLVTID